MHDTPLSGSPNRQKQISVDYYYRYYFKNEQKLFQKWETTKTTATNKQTKKRENF